MARRSWSQALEGEWHQPPMRGYKVGCCHCLLVHRFDFRIRGKRVQMRAFRDERSTAALRREAKKRGKS